MSRFSRSMAPPKDRAWLPRSEPGPSARAPLAAATRARRNTPPLACLPAPTSQQGAGPAILPTLPVGPSPSRGRGPWLRVRPSPSACAHAVSEQAGATGAPREAQRDRSARQTTGRGARPRGRADGKAAEPHGRATETGAGPGCRLPPPGGASAVSTAWHGQPARAGPMRRRIVWTGAFFPAKGARHDPLRSSLPAPTPPPSLSRPPPPAPTQYPDLSPPCPGTFPKTIDTYCRPRHP